ncbi:hypothetical protein [Mesorhizobium sp. LjNodule214]|uniref:T4 family baseplate hub assembly chaperone n=1 Tax=Mesorhizobium sp. LjNodule214 TaxID=3342252 RepID=UPI003ECCEAFF
MRESATVLLAHGLPEAGVRHLDAQLRGLTGHEEAMIGDCPVRITPAECTTAVLAAVTRRIGKLESVTPEMVAELVVGDRERLLLTLCEMTFGPELDLVTTCPKEGCGAVSEVPVWIGDIIGRQEAVAEIEHEIRPATPKGEWQIRFRLPSGCDQERAAQAALSNPADAARALIIGCVVAITDPSGAAVPPGELPAAFETALSDAFQRLDPFAESTTAIVCPVCRTETKVVLDAFSVLHAGLNRGAGIYADVYRMARAYHWNERDILALPLARRKRYLELASGVEGGA